LNDAKKLMCEINMNKYSFSIQEKRDYQIQQRGVIFHMQDWFVAKESFAPPQV